MNNKNMYTRCIVPELTTMQEWKVEEDKESKELRKLQKSFENERKKKQKAKQQEKYYNVKGKNEKGTKKRQKKQWEKLIVFRRKENAECRKRYEKVINRKMHMDLEKLKATLHEALMIHTHFERTYTDVSKVTPNIQRGVKRKKGRNSQKRRFPHNMTHSTASNLHTMNDVTFESETALSTTHMRLIRHRQIQVTHKMSYRSINTYKGKFRTNLRVVGWAHRGLLQNKISEKANRPLHMKEFKCKRDNKVKGREKDKPQRRYIGLPAQDDTVIPKHLLTQQVN